MLSRLDGQFRMRYPSLSLLTLRSAAVHILRIGTSLYEYRWSLGPKIVGFRDEPATGRRNLTILFTIK